MSTKAGQKLVNINVKSFQKNLFFCLNNHRLVSLKHSPLAIILLLTEVTVAFHILIPGISDVLIIFVTCDSSYPSVPALKARFHAHFLMNSNTSISIIAIIKNYTMRPQSETERVGGQSTLFLLIIKISIGC